MVVEKQGPTTCKGKKRSEYQLNTERVGQRLVLEDQVRTLNWVLSCHGGFITHPHHDAAGYATFMILNCGAKFWAIQKPDLSTETPNRQELYAAFDQLLSGKEGSQMAGCLLLEQGDVLYVVHLFCSVQSFKHFEASSLPTYFIASLHP
jgi:hypothetical protein